jgi:hypothetical protein
MKAADFLRSQMLASSGIRTSKFFIYARKEVFKVDSEYIKRFSFAEHRAFGSSTQETSFVNDDTQLLIKWSRKTSIYI